MAFVFNKSSPATGSIAIFNLKACLVAAGWVVKSSGDGLALYSAVGDILVSGAAGVGGLGNLQAWFRIQDPGGVAEFIFQRGGTNLVWRQVWSALSKFIGGAPSPIQVPTAADEVLVIGAGSAAVPAFYTRFSADGSYRWNVGADATAPYAWWAAAFVIGGGPPLTAIVYEAVTAGAPGDSNIYIVYNAASAAAASPFIAGAGSGNDMSSSSQTAIGSYLSAHVASLGVGALVDMPAMKMTYDGGPTAVPKLMGTNPLTGKDEAVPITFMRPAPLAGAGYKGLSTVMLWQGNARATGDTLTISTPRDRIVYGDVSLPWDGSVPVV